jgi:hypothetical protein
MDQEVSAEGREHQGDGLSTAGYVCEKSAVTDPTYVRTANTTYHASQSLRKVNRRCRYGHPAWARLWRTCPQAVYWLCLLLALEVMHAAKIDSNLRNWVYIAVSMIFSRMIHGLPRSGDAKSKSINKARAFLHWRA